jgi:hypothetical protein
MQCRLDGRQGQVQLDRDLVERMVENVLEDDAAALRWRQHEEGGERGADRLAPRHRVVGLERRRLGDVERGIERLARTMPLVAPVIDRAMVRDAESQGLSDGSSRSCGSS